MTQKVIQIPTLGPVGPTPDYGLGLRFDPSTEGTA
jgi:hypothetical protein